MKSAPVATSTERQFLRGWSRPAKEVRLGTPRRVRRDFVGGADVTRPCSKPVLATKARGVCAGGGTVGKCVSGCLSDEEPISGGAFCIIALPHSGARRAPRRLGLELRLERRPRRAARSGRHRNARRLSTIGMRPPLRVVHGSLRGMLDGVRSSERRVRGDPMFRNVHRNVYARQHGHAFPMRRPAARLSFNEAQHGLHRSARGQHSEGPPALFFRDERRQMRLRHGRRVPGTSRAIQPPM